MAPPHRPLLSVVIPTIGGREQLLEQTTAALRRALPPEDLELIVVRNRDTIGEAWQLGAGFARGGFVLLGADDVVIDADAIAAGIDAASDGLLPSPLLVRADGSAYHAGTMGGGMLMDAPTGTVCGSSPFPLMRRGCLDAIGKLPPIHYYCDDYVAWAARQFCDLQPTVIRGYRILHLEGTIGRGRMVARAAQDRQGFVDAIAERMAKR